MIVNCSEKVLKGSTKVYMFYCFQRVCKVFWNRVQREWLWKSPHVLTEVAFLSGFSKGFKNCFWNGFDELEQRFSKCCKVFFCFLRRHGKGVWTWIFFFFAQGLEKRCQNWKRVWNACKWFERFLQRGSKDFLRLKKVQQRSGYSKEFFEWIKKSS